MPRESAMSRLKAGSALRVAGPPARRLMIPVHLIAAEACPGSRHAGLDVLGEETRGRVVVDERLVSEPLDSSAAGTGVAEGIPRGQQVRVLLVQFVFEPAEGALALDSPRQPPPARSSLTCSAKSAMSWYQMYDGSGCMPIRSSSSRSTGVWPSIPVSDVQKTISPVSGLISHRCS